MEKKKVLICGAGSIGVYLGTKLHSKNHDVKLFGRRKLHGVRDRVIIEGREFQVPERVFEIPKKEKHDFIFITTKLYDFDKMIGIIKRNEIKGQIIAAIQNGLVDTSKHSKILGKRIIPVTVFSGFNLKNNEIHVNATPVGWKTEFSKAGKEVSRLISDAGIKCEPAKNFDSLRAEKTIVNCCLNALSAIENKRFCDLFKTRKTRERIEKLFHECYDILAKEYELESAEKMKKNMIKNWHNLKHYSSTCQDINSGRKNEVKYFNGYIVELGKKHNLPTEHNRQIIIDTREIKR
jgi:2-dehydropantoate 2-reductase